MTRGGKTCWKAIRVLGAGAPGQGALAGADRLAALYRFQNGEPSPGHRFFVEGAREGEAVDPEQFDWSTFPVFAALEAVTRDEVRRLRSLLHDGGAETRRHDGGAETPPNPPSPSLDSSSPLGAARRTPPFGNVWGVDLRRGADV